MEQQQDFWKQKYLEHLDKLEKAEATWHALENQLRQGMNRVALAAQGVDSELDEYLALLRKSIRSGGDYTGLEKIVENISATVKKIDETRKNEQKKENQPLIAFHSMVKSIGFPKQNQKQVKTLLKKIKKDKTHSNLSVYTNELASLINSSLQRSNPSNAESDKPGFLQRIFQDNTPNLGTSTVGPGVQETSRIDSRLFVDLIDALPGGPNSDRSKRIRNDFLNWDGVSEVRSLVDQLADYISELMANQGISKAGPDLDLHRKLDDSNNENVSDKRLGEFCFRLLCFISFPEFCEDTLSALKDQVSSGIGPDDTVNVLRSIAGLVADAQLHLEKEKNDLQDFLRQLTESLKEIDLHLAGAETERLASVKSSYQLDEAVNSQVDNLRKSVNEATTLDLMKARVNERLDAIREHLSDHNRLQEKHQYKLENALRLSNSRLHELEQETKALQERLCKEHEQAIHDALTGIYNRLAYEERIDQEYSRWKRYKVDLSILIFDIDHFKQVNDIWGHKAGDKALKLIATNLQKNLRESDFLARYGGEEFVVIMPETKIKAALVAANKLREAVQACEFHYQEKRVEITVSCGIAQFSKTDTIDSAFQRADSYMYMAKQAGRNRCHSKD